MEMFLINVRVFSFNSFLELFFTNTLLWLVRIDDLYILEVFNLFDGLEFSFLLYIDLFDIISDNEDRVFLKLIILILQKLYKIIEINNKSINL